MLEPYLNLCLMLVVRGPGGSTLWVRRFSYLWRGVALYKNLFLKSCLSSLQNISRVGYKLDAYKKYAFT